jgi:hypothetical protein
LADDAEDGVEALPSASAVISRSSRLVAGEPAIYWVSCFVVMTRVLRYQWAPFAIAGASLVALVWLEAFVW